MTDEMHRAISGVGHGVGSVTVEDFVGAVFTRRANRRVYRPTPTMHR
jgi:hypothetical protein